jgi:Flp pilus assembly CpaE family ATPase
MNDDVKKEFAIRSLKRIIEAQQAHAELKRLGVDLSDYEKFIDLQEEVIVLLLVKDEHRFDHAINDLHSFIYRGLKRIILLDSDEDIDVSTPELFVSWFENFYG